RGLKSSGATRRLPGSRHTRVVVQAGLVEQNAVLVVVEPERLGVAADDADLAAVGGAAGVPKNLEDQDAILAARESRYPLVGDRRHFGLAFVMGDGKARVRLDARQALLRGVENIPGGLDRDVKRLVGDDVAPAEEVVVLAAGALELALQNAEAVRVIVDTPHDRRLVLHGEPAAPGQAPHPLVRR